MINLHLLLDQIYSSYRAKKFPGLRTQHTLSNGFTDPREESANREKRFKTFLSKNKFQRDPIILQENPHRGRIVFHESGAIINEVIKWIDKDGVGCFNFIENHEVEKEIHKMGEKYSIIPRLISHSEQHISVEHFYGKSLLHYYSDSNLNNLEAAIDILYKGLLQFYLGTTHPTLKASSFNKTLNSDYLYFTSTRGGLSKKFVLAAAKAPRGFEKIHLECLRNAITTYKESNHTWMSCWNLRDLDEHNILYNKERDSVCVVDVEDARRTSPVFDLAYLTSRLTLTEEPMRTSRYSYLLANDLIDNLKYKESDDLKKTLPNLICSLLIMIAINPWLWPSNSTFDIQSAKHEKTSKWLKDLWHCIHHYHKISEKVRK